MSLDKPAGPETYTTINCFALSINAAVTPYMLSKHLSIPVHINKAETSQLALLDCGAMGNFINENIVKQLGLTCTPRTPIPLHDVKGLKIGELTFQVTIPVDIGAHQETLTLDVAPIGSHSIILGLPWFQVHNPTLNWQQGQVQFNSDYCNGHCLPHPHDIFTKLDHTPLDKPDITMITPQA